MGGKRAKIGTAVVVTLATMLLQSVPASAADTVSKRADHGWDYAIASNHYSWEYGHESTMTVCDKEPDNSYVWGYFTTFDGERHALSNSFFTSRCTTKGLKGNGKQIRSFTVCEDGDGCSPEVYLDKATG